MKTIPLSQGKVALIDDDLFEEYNHHKWTAQYKRGKWYAVRRKGNKVIKMHREITKAPVGMKVDHWDGNGLNNQHHNLRVCTNAQNSYNRGMSRKNKSGYKGVYWNRANQKWRATIVINRKTKNLGDYETAEAAAHAYDREAAKHHGRFARLNFSREVR